MCGIYLTNKKINSEVILEKLDLIKYRGPDHTGIIKIDEIWLAHLRLSIIDLDERANQPMLRNNLYIVFNGEIYNYKEIKNELIALSCKFETQSDTEVILVGYEMWGERIVDKLNGMFSFCIYDTKKRRIFCARDRLGVKPFYYSWNNGEIEICSQLQPFSNKKVLNKESVGEYLDLGYIPSPYTIYKDIYKLEPGCSITFDLESETFSIRRYWDLEKINDINFNRMSYEEVKNSLHDLLKDAVKIRMHSDVPIGTFLSGGIDSALVSSIASQYSDINTFTIGFDNAIYDESKTAYEYSRILNTNHIEEKCDIKDVLELLPKLIETYDEPFSDSSALPSLLLNKVTKKYVTVALSGDGGDEGFIGYLYFDWLNKFVRVLKIPYVIRYIFSLLISKKIFKNRTDNYKSILQSKNINEFILKLFYGFNSITSNNFKSGRSKHRKYLHLTHNVFQKAADLNIKLWLENDSNVKVDRASMAYSVEVRSPFLDYRIIEFSRRIPMVYKYDGKVKKKILKDILKEYIPEEVFNLPKKGFSVPLKSWINNELRAEIENILTDKFLNSVPYLNVNKFKKMMINHFENNGDYSLYIYRVYILAKWLEVNRNNHIAND